MLAAFKMILGYNRVKLRNNHKLLLKNWPILPEETFLAFHAFAHYLSNSLILPRVLGLGTQEHSENKF